MIEQSWNGRDENGRKALLEVLGLSYKGEIVVDNRLFEELPQLHQKQMIHAADVVSLI